MSGPYFDIFEASHAASKRKGFGWNFLHLESCDSTNTYCKTHLNELKLPILVTTSHQTAGRGRGSNEWHDEPKGSFLSTWCLELLDGPLHPSVTLGIGLYAFEALSEAFPVKLSMKAPNDIYLGEKKVGGLLIEQTSEGDYDYLYIGLGLNVFSYPANLGATATHLSAYMGSDQLNADTFGDFLQYFGSALLNMETRINLDMEKWIKRLNPRLVSALNRHPEHAKNPVQGVNGDGSLTTAGGPISWQNL